MPKKAQLPPGAAGRSQQTLARRNRRDALGKWLRRYAGVAAVAVLAWAAKTAWPRARRKLFPRKPSRRVKEKAVPPAPLSNQIADLAIDDDRPLALRRPPRLSALPAPPSPTNALGV